MTCLVNYIITDAFKLRKNRLDRPQAFFHKAKWPAIQHKVHLFVVQTHLPQARQPTFRRRPGTLPAAFAFFGA